MTEETALYDTHSPQEPPQNTLTPLARVFAAAECRRQVELAEFLGIRQSFISDAKKRQAIPADWLVTLLRLKGINPEWILTGLGPVRLGPVIEQTPAQAACRTETRPPEDCSAQELVNELVRRALGGVRP